MNACSCIFTVDQFAQTVQCEASCSQNCSRLRPFYKILVQILDLAIPCDPEGCCSSQNGTFAGQELIASIAILPLTYSDLYKPAQLFRISNHLEEIYGKLIAPTGSHSLLASCCARQCRKSEIRGSRDCVCSTDRLWHFVGI